MMPAGVGAEYKQQELEQFAIAQKHTNEVREKKAAKVNAGKFKGNKIHSDSGKYYSYPAARGPSDETGDTLLIKCVEYIPPTSDAEIKSGAASNQMGLEAFTIKGQSTKGDKVSPASVSTAGKTGSIIPRNFGMTADARVRQKQKIKYYVELPIPQDIADTQSVTWGEDTMNMFQLAGLAVGAKAIESPGQLASDAVGLARDAFTTGVEIPGLNKETQNAFKAAISGKAINALGANVNPRNVVSRATGQVLNSNLELLFGGVNLRSFPFSINFSPRSETEGDLVKEIIRAFKKSMSAKAGGADSYNGASASGIMIKAPDVFLLEYRSRGRTHPFLNSFKTCAMTGISVNYTNSGTYATYQNSTPVNIRMDLTFKELNPIYAEDYDTPNAGPGVGY